MSHIDTVHPFLGAFIMLILAITIFSVILKASSFIGKKLANRDTQRLKSAIYECGPEALKQPNKIKGHYYLIAVLFILFDIEIIFMFPWAVDFKILGIFGLIEMFLFIGLLILGYIYALRKGAFNWQSIR